MKPKYKIFNIILSAIILISLNFNCKKTEIEQINLTGSITGNVYNVPETDGVGDIGAEINVSIENSVLSTSTDEKGQYTIDNIPSGTYSIIFSKDGYSDTKECGVQIIGKADYPVKIAFNAIYEKSSTVASNLSVVYNDNEIIFSADFTPEAVNTFQRGIFICISDNKNVAFDNNLDWYYTRAISGSNASVTLNSETLAMYLPGFNPQNTYYVIAYGMSQTYGQYFDPVKGSYVYTGLNETSTNIVSFTIPSK